MSERALHFTVVGLSDSRSPYWRPELLERIAAHHFFSGGRRHQEIVSSILPAGSQWIPITVPLADVFARYRSVGGPILVFASGDPLFFGFASTLRREFPEAAIEVFPEFNSLQLLAHRLLLPYQEMRMVSLTGRPWDRFDQALIEGEPMIGVLTDLKKTPDQIAQRMRAYGYMNYRVSVGEELGNEVERVRSFTVDEAAQAVFHQPNCLILERTAIRPRPLGLPDASFELLDGRVNMITKMPIRLAALAQMDLRERHSFWDIGFCTGSVSIEAKAQFPHLKITAFERREVCAGIIERNARRWGTPGITAVMGDFLAQDLSLYPRPDAVFIGGHGGRLVEVLEAVASRLSLGGVIVFNSVTEESKQMFLEGLAAIGRPLKGSVRMMVDAYNPIEIWKA